MSDGHGDKVLSVRFVTVFGAALLFVLSNAGCGTQEDGFCGPRDRLDGTRATMAERYSRLLAIESPKPRYPAMSVESGTSGIAVSKVFVDENGHTEEVCVLQVPDAAIREAVTRTLMHWTFEKVTTVEHSEGIPMASKLSFYFVVKDGVGLVLSPEEMLAALDIRQRSVTGASATYGSAVTGQGVGR